MSRHTSVCCSTTWAELAVYFLQCRNLSSDQRYSAALFLIYVRWADPKLYSQAACRTGPASLLPSSIIDGQVHFIRYLGIPCPLEREAQGRRWRVEPSCLPPGGLSHWVRCTWGGEGSSKKRPVRADLRIHGRPTPDSPSLHMPCRHNPAGRQVRRGLAPTGTYWHLLAPGR